MKNIRDTRHEIRATNHGFTLVEIIMVVVIIAIAAAMAIPFAVSGADFQLGSAANIIASDLEYAKSMAISRGKNYSVIFAPASESYQIEDASGVIGHPIKKGSDYIINFANDNRTARVDISSTSFTSDTVVFDYLGSPDNGGTVNIQAGSGSLVVNVEAVTGYITISE